MDRKKFFILAGALSALGIVLAVIIFSIPALREFGKTRFGSSGSGESTVANTGRSVPGAKEEGVRTFASESEFIQYFANSAETSFGSGGGFRSGMAVASMKTSESSSQSFSNPLAFDSSSAPRVSETNVRTEGLDEPDIVKTDGSHIYYSREARYTYRGGPEPMPLSEPMTNDSTVSSGSAGAKQIGIMPSPYQSSATTDIFSATGAGEVALLGSIGKSGETLLFGDTLVLFEASGQAVFGYDVSNRKNPKEKWTMTIGDGSEILEARKSGNKLYIVERTGVGGAHPCPIRLMTVGTTVSEIACTDIYRPETSSGADSVFTASYVNPSTGMAGDTVSFVGSSGQSVVYVSAESIFVTYQKQVDPVGLLLGFFQENTDLFSSDFLSKMERLSGYDIGAEAKTVELGRLIQNEMLGKDQDEQLRLQNEMSNKMADYGKRHLREFGSTGIVKIALSNFKVTASSSVPGAPLNDFSLDESGGYLRIATTVGGRGGVYLPIFSSQDIPSENDVYVLDKNMKRTGELLGLGEGERIYSARFIGDRGYLVTFKETDPFYVLDLSDPTDPKKTGELKIPGYSSYLHPLGEHLVLGIGREENKVKLSLFDVSDPTNPQEISKYLLDEYWSEATNDHRAFLADTDHKVFFVPGSRGGYVLSYDRNTLSLKKAVSGQSIRRALYIGDTLYVIGDTAITAFNENTWEKKGEVNITR